MSFLKKIEAKEKETYISFEEIYESDPQYKQLISFTTDILYKFAKKFKMREEDVVDLFINSIKKEML